MKKNFKTRGMHCKSCEILLQDGISEISGVKSVKASHSKNEVEVEFEEPATEARIIQAIKKEGYGVEA
ncbi:MAG: heavy-metal-associated domain-containing protein [Candidatus Micrarchaeota archaeon]